MKDFLASDDIANQRVLLESVELLVGSDLACLLGLRNLLFEVDPLAINQVFDVSILIGIEGADFQPYFVCVRILSYTYNLKLMLTNTILSRLQDGFILLFY